MSAEVDTSKNTKIDDDLLQINWFVRIHNKPTNNGSLGFVGFINKTRLIEFDDAFISDGPGRVWGFVTCPGEPGSI